MRLWHAVDLGPRWWWRRQLPQKVMGGLQEEKGLVQLLEAVEARVSMEPERWKLLLETWCFRSRTSAISHPMTSGRGQKMSGLS